MLNSYLSIIFIVFIGSSVRTQITIRPKSELKRQVHHDNNQGVYYSEYVVMPEKLKTFFHSGEIPTSFPKYDKYKTYDENKVIAKNWAKENKNLIKEEFWFKFEDK